MDYIHYNPVKHGWVTSVNDWPYSTFPKLVERGIYPQGWTSGEGNLRGMGERDE